jgi:hypothetical protein
MLAGSKATVIATNAPAPDPGLRLDGRLTGSAPR